MSEPEWLSTRDARYWHHTPCGKSVELRSGVPVRHTCTKLESSIPKEENRMSQYTSAGKCFDCGSTVHGPQRGQHSNFHANFIHRAEVKDGFAVSAVKWCDQGSHAFKANAPGSQSIDVMQRGEDGVEERVVMDMCGEHAFPTGVSTPPTRAIEAYSAEEIQARYNKLMNDRLNTSMNTHHNED